VSQDRREFFGTIVAAGLSGRLANGQSGAEGPIVPGPWGPPADGLAAAPEWDLSGVGKL